MTDSSKDDRPGKATGAIERLGGHTLGLILSACRAYDNLAIHGQGVEPDRVAFAILVAPN